MTIPENISQVAAELQAAYDNALAKANEAHRREEEAVQARALAEEAKATGRAANSDMETKRAGFLALVSGFYQAPGLPAPAANGQQPVPG